jgi:hypothetical protein
MPPSPCPPGADAFDQRALRDELDLHFAGHHLPLRLGIEADVAGDHLANQLGLDELANSLSRRCRVIGDYGELAFVLTHDLVDDPLGRAHRHEAADHQACAIGNHRDCLFKTVGGHKCVQSDVRASCGPSAALV